MDNIICSDAIKLQDIVITSASNFAHYVNLSMIYLYTPSLRLWVYINDKIIGFAIRIFSLKIK